MLSFRKDECTEGKRGKQDAGKCERVLFDTAADERYLRDAGKCDGGCVRKRNEHARDQKKAPGYTYAPFNKTCGNPRNRSEQKEKYDKDNLGLYQRYPEKRYEKYGQQRNKEKHAPLRD